MVRGMAKAREIAGLSAEHPYGEVAARVLEVRCEELLDNAAGVLDVTRIEGVHDMRVATRRLRAAIEVFWPCFPPRLGKQALAEVKALADALGERRDRDVAIEVLGTFAEAMPHPDRPGISSLIGELRAEQGAANHHRAATIEPARLQRLRDELLELAAAARAAAPESDDPEAAEDG
jgi:CHAD domain-containing protein